MTLNNTTVDYEVNCSAAMQCIINMCIGSLFLYVAQHYPRVGPVSVCLITNICSYKQGYRA